MSNEYIESTIKSINSDNGIIWINKVNNSQPKDFMSRKEYYEQTLSVEDLNKLKVGVKVRFKPVETNGSYIAQELELAVRSESDYIESTVKSIDLKAGIIWIHKIDASQPKDFMAKQEFYEKTLLPEDLNNLTVGTRVKFKFFQKNNSYIAQELDIVRNVNLDNKNNNSNSLNDKISVDFNLATSIEENILKTLDNIQNGAEFEEITFLILKSLGLSEVYSVPRENQAGQADGYFKGLYLSNSDSKLEVIYDCTLKPKYKWENEKRTQILNYTNHITKNFVKIEYRYLGRNQEWASFDKEVRFNSNADKQVWIITKDSTRLISEEEGVKIKEVSIYDLVKILVVKVLKKSNYSRVNDVTEELSKLGSVNY